MTYYISPNGSPLHTIKLFARADSEVASPYMPSDKTIEWRIDGIPIYTKTGNTSDVSLLSINSGDPNDFNLTAKDTGAVVDFLIDNTIYSNPVIISNAVPTLTYAGPVVDSSNISTTRPTFTWGYSDIDGDHQFFYRIRIGSTYGGSDIYDSGKVFSNDNSFTYPEEIDEIPRGIQYFWRLDVGDGEKINVLDLDDPEPARVTVTLEGSATSNRLPVPDSITIAGQASGEIDTKNPRIAWTFYDEDGHTQYGFRIIVSRDENRTDILWDSGELTNITATDFEYNFNGTGQELSSHQELYLSISLSDEIEFGEYAHTTFTVSGTPLITSLTVNSRINPLNVATQTPTFNWEYSDVDGDPLVSYEIRVSDINDELGSDTFRGKIWSPGIITTPESYSTVFNFDGSAFNECDIHYLQDNVTYWFQVQIRDAYKTSAWETGFFQLNIPPTADNLAIIPNPAFGSDDLVATYFFNDPGDSEDPRTQIMWYKKYSTASVFSEITTFRNLKVVPNSYTAPGDVWKFSVRPHDGTIYGALATSSTVTIYNRAPRAGSLLLLPPRPKTSDSMSANFEISDADADEVTVSINWFRNGLEQAALRNSKVVPPYFTAIGDQWYFTVVPKDKYSTGEKATSAKVIIVNTRPKISAFTINGAFYPILAKQNPLLAWTYQDDDFQVQTHYQLIVGSRPIRTSKPRGNIPAGSNNGITSVANGTGTILSGNEVFDSGVVLSKESSYKYTTDDSLPNTILYASNFASMRNYFFDGSLDAIALGPIVPDGTASAKFQGQTALYDMTLSFLKEEGRKSSFNVYVDGFLVGNYIVKSGTGTETKLFKAVRIASNASITIVGSSDSGAHARFKSVTLTPIIQLEIDATDFDTMSGYIPDGDGGIKLSGLLGTATKKFVFASGVYDIEITYITETTGSPSLTVYVNSTTIDSFSFETGAKTRVRQISGIILNSGDTLNITGTKNLSAAARIKKVVFKPKSTVSLGARLNPGERYYASVRVCDGLDWSDWYSTTFTMSGSTWSSVSNSTGWTIEARLAIVR